MESNNLFKWKKNIIEDNSTFINGFSVKPLNNSDSYLLFNSSTTNKDGKFKISLLSFNNGKLSINPIDSNETYPRFRITHVFIINITN